MKGAKNTQQLYILDQLQDHIHTLTFCQERVLISICPPGEYLNSLEGSNPEQAFGNIYGEIVSEREKLLGLLDEVTIYRDGLMKIK